MKAFLITLTLAALLGVAPAQEPATVPCSKAKCEEIRLYNRAVELRNEEDEKLKLIEQSLLTNHPTEGLVAAERIAALDAAIKDEEAVEQLYRQAATLIHERAHAHRLMREVETKR